MEILMKIYTQDCSWCGSIVVVAENKEQAIELMKPCCNFDQDLPVEEHEIISGFVFCNVGDM
jgi:hypothetical protein